MILFKFVGYRGRRAWNAVIVAGVVALAVVVVRRGVDEGVGLGGGVGDGEREECE